MACGMWKLGLAGCYLSLVSAKNCSFSRTGFPGMHIVGSPLKMQSSQLTGVSTPSFQQHAGCVMGVGVATRILFVVLVLCSTVSSLDLMNSLPLKSMKNDLEKYFKILRKQLVSSVQVLLGRQRAVEICRPPQACPAAQNEKGACGHFSLSEVSLYGLWATCRFGSSKNASQYLGQYFVCGWGLTRRILCVFGF